MTSSSDSVNTSVKWLPFPVGAVKSETIKLNFSVVNDGIYQLTRPDFKAIPQLFDVWLMDAYKKDSVDIRHNDTYSFNVTKSDTNSFGANRFSIIVRQNTAYAYRLLNFTAAKSDGMGNDIDVFLVTQRRGFTRGSGRNDAIHATLDLKFNQIFECRDVDLAVFKRRDNGSISTGKHTAFQ